MDWTREDKSKESIVILSVKSLFSRGPDPLGKGKVDRGTLPGLLGPGNGPGWAHIVYECSSVNTSGWRQGGNAHPYNKSGWRLGARQLPESMFIFRVGCTFSKINLDSKR